MGFLTINICSIYAAFVRYKLEIGVSTIVNPINVQLCCIHTHSSRQRLRVSVYTLTTLCVWFRKHSVCWQKRCFLANGSFAQKLQSLIYGVGSIAYEPITLCWTIILFHQNCQCTVLIAFYFMLHANLFIRGSVLPIYTLRSFSMQQHFSSNWWYHITYWIWIYSIFNVCSTPLWVRKVCV